MGLGQALDWDRPFAHNYTPPAAEPPPLSAYVWPHAGKLFRAHAPFLFFGWLVCPVPVV